MVPTMASGPQPPAQPSAQPGRSPNPHSSHHPAPRGGCRAGSSAIHPLLPTAETSLWSPGPQLGFAPCRGHSEGWISAPVLCCTGSKQASWSLTTQLLSITLHLWTCAFFFFKCIFKFILVIYIVLKLSILSRISTVLACHFQSPLQF